MAKQVNYICYTNKDINGNINKYIIQSKRIIIPDTNILIFATHIHFIETMIQRYRFNFKNANYTDISTIIIVYSSVDSKYYSLLEFFDIFNDKNIIILHDIDNKYYDFGKYLIGYKYIIDNNLIPEYVHLLNDSILITKPINNIHNGIKKKIILNDLVGILLTNENYMHYQSWWLVINKTILKKYFERIILESNTQLNINKNEISNCNYFITNFKCDSIFNFNTNKIENIFFNCSEKYIQAYNNGFYFLKIRSLITNKDSFSIEKKAQYSALI